MHRAPGHGLEQALPRLAVVLQQIYYRWAKGKTTDARFGQLTFGVRILSEQARTAIHYGLQQRRRSWGYLPALQRPPLPVPHADHRNLCGSRVDMIEHDIAASLQHVRACVRVATQRKSVSDLGVLRDGQQCCVQFLLKQPRCAEPVLLPPSSDGHHVRQRSRRDADRERRHAQRQSEPVQDRAEHLERNRLAATHR
jgi:hypothetical protein